LRFWSAVERVIAREMAAAEMEKVGNMFRKAFVVSLLCVPWGASAAYATTIDLTTVDSTSTTTCLGVCTSANGVLFVADWADEASTGTGVIDSFVRVQSNTTSEQGYNTSIDPPPLDTKNGAHTHTLLLSELTLVTLADSQQYYQFLLDIGQDLGHEDELLSLNQVQIFQSATDQHHDSVNATSPIIDFGGDASEVFRLSDFSATTWEILLDAGLNSGNGSGDMFLYVRASAFDPDFGDDSADDYIILYSQFGTPPGSSQTNDGPEEWALFGVPGGNPCLSVSCGIDDPQEPAVPEPASLLLLSTGLGMIAQRVRRKKKAEPKL
jgi:hypothetical protein